MLSFSELITYEPISLFFLVAGIGVTLFGIHVLIKKGKGSGDKVFGSIFTIFGIFVVIFFGAAIVNGSVTTATITPCEIVSNANRNCNLVADTSENLYNVCNLEEQIKLHVNQTSDVTVINKFLERHPTIVRVTGKACPSVSAC